MKRVKWKRWLAIAGISAVLVGGAGLWAMDHAADFILKSIVEKPADKTQTAAAKKPESGEEQAGNGVGGRDGSGQKDSTPDGSSAQTEPGKDAKLPSSQSQNLTEAGKPSPGAGNGKKDGPAYSAAISSDKAEQVQEEVTAQEKAFVMTTILKKFSPEEMNLFMRLASGGLSVEEKKEAKKIFLQKLSEEEYNKLIAIASKYGLSQGKSYQDSLKQK